MLVCLLSLLEDEEDRAIFTSIFEQYERTAYAICFSILHDQHDAEDAVMAAWEKVVRHFDTAKEYLSKPAPAFEGWLITVTKNAAKDEQRRKNRTPEPVEIWDMPSSANTETESGYRMMVALVKTMPKPTRMLLEMRLVMGYSWKKIGKRLGCSDDTAQKRYSRAVEELKRRMGEE